MPVNLDLYKAVVRLTNVSGGDNRTSLGSGVIFTPTGLIITNNHVIEDADFGTAFGETTVELIERADRPPSQSVPAQIVIRNEVFDLAVLKMDGAAPRKFIDILCTPSIDESLMERRIRVLGYPPLGGGTITVTRGIVSGFDELGNLKTDAEINPGNSGGAAFDDLDTFLGIPTFIIADAQGKLGFIISRDRIRQWLGTVLKSGVPKSTQEVADAFEPSNLIFDGDNVDLSNQYPRILSKFAAIEALLSRGQYDRCIPHIQYILEKRPRSALAYHYLGNALLGAGRYVEAATQFRFALTYNPNHIPALGNFGVTLCHLGRFGEALQLFEQIIDLTDNPAELHVAYGNIAKIYEDWNQPQVSELYRRKADELSAAAAQRLSKYRHPHDPADKIAALTDAIMNAEIELGEGEEDQADRD